MVLSATWECVCVRLCDEVYEKRLDGVEDRKGFEFREEKEERMSILGKCVYQQNQKEWLKKENLEKCPFLWLRGV